MSTAPTPSLTLRPKFDKGLVVVESLLFSAVAVPVVTVLLGTVLYILLSTIGVMRFFGVGYLYGLIFVLSILIIPTLFFEQKKKAYARTVFKFYPRYLEYQYFHFYLTLRRGRIKYGDVENVLQQASALQEQRRLMTVSLFVPMMRYQRKGYPGIHIPDLPQAQDYATHILNVIENSHRLPPEEKPIPSPTLPAVETPTMPTSPVTGNVPPPAPEKIVTADE